MERKVGGYTFTDEEIKDVFGKDPEDRHVKFEQLSLFDDEEDTSQVKKD